MSLSSILAALEATPFATAIREGSYLFPWIESVHVLAIVLVVGVVFVMDLRLIGVAAGGQGLHRLLKESTPLVWAAFAVAALTGFLLFSSSATTYAANPAFRLKLVALAAAGLNMLLFHRVSLRGAESWDALTRPPAQARLAGAISMICWVAVVGTGRWIGFLA